MPPSDDLARERCRVKNPECPERSDEPDMEVAAGENVDHPYVAFGAVAVSTPRDHVPRRGAGSSHGVARRAAVRDTRAGPAGARRWCQGGQRLCHSRRIGGISPPARGRRVVLANAKAAARRTTAAVVARPPSRMESTGSPSLLPLWSEAGFIAPEGSSGSARCDRSRVFQDETRPGAAGRQRRHGDSPPARWRACRLRHRSCGRSDDRDGTRLDVVRW